MIYTFEKSWRKSIDPRFISGGDANTKRLERIVKKLLRLLVLAFFLF